MEGMDEFYLPKVQLIFREWSTARFAEYILIKRFERPYFGGDGYLQTEKPASQVRLVPSLVFLFFLNSKTNEY
jgi:hypothetical protein